MHYELSNRQRQCWRVAAVAWLAVVLLVATHQVKFWHEDSLTFDILALLPADEQAPELDIATRKLADGMSRQVIVMLGASDWETVRHAAGRFRETIKQSPAGLQEQAVADPSTMIAIIESYRPWRDRLLNAEQRHRLETTSVAALSQQALASLHQPGASSRISSWTGDPLGLWQEWWSTRAAESPARPRDDLLWLHADGLHWATLIYDIPRSAFNLTGDPVYATALDQAWQTARSRTSDLQWLRAGIPLHAEAGASQANREINIIGLGSLAGVILLTWIAFRSLRAIVLVGTSLVIACAVALSATAWVFGQVHLITLIFGASLVGVAEDYGIHYFATRQGHPTAKPLPLLVSLLPALLVALATSVFAYLALGVAAFPGLRQMAFFSAVGLIAAMITVVVWFPFLDRGVVKKSRFGSWLGGTLAGLPRLSRRSPSSWLFLGLAAFVAIWGLARITVQDDVRQLQSSPPQLLADQQRIGRLLNLPSPAQFYLVQGPDAEALLQREEILTQRLDALKAAGHIAGYSAISNWVPSMARQAQDAATTAHIEGEVLAATNAMLGEELARPVYEAHPLEVDQWLAQPMALMGKSLWLGEVGHGVMSVVMLRGVTTQAVLPHLHQAAAGLAGVRWVDRPGELSSLLKRYRGSMTGLLIAGHLLVFAIVSWRFGRTAWRAWLPTALASIGVVAIMSWMGEPWQLFNILALALLLGVGVDYGIFLLEHDNEPSAWLAVVIGAGSTWLSFGLLGLSEVPALRAFGLTLMVGLVLVLILAPLLRAPLHPRPSTPTALASS